METKTVENSIYGKNFRICDLFLKIILFLGFFIVSTFFIYFLFFIFKNGLLRQALFGIGFILFILIIIINISFKKSIKTVKF